MPANERERENSGVLFPERQKKNERGPDHTGRAQLTCPHCEQQFRRRVAAWNKEGRNGSFLSLAFSEERDDRPL